MASGQPALQTFVLKVSIHCHGCKKKVRKVLKSVEGVKDVKVDAQQHKVTVTGTVDAQTLIQRLQKSGKQALQWQNLHAAPAKDPEPAPAAEAPAPAPAAESGGKNDAAAAEKKPEQEAAASEKQVESEDKKTESEKKEEAKPSDEAKKGGGESESAEPAKEKVAEPAKEAASAAPAKEAGNGESDAKEKKQSKPKDVAAGAVDRSLPPRQHAHQEYSPYYAPQPVMSYHMAQPKASVSYYAPQPQQGYSMQQQPPPQPQPGYSSMMHQPQEAYSQQGQPMQQWSPSYLYMPYPHASPESYYQDYYSPPGTHAPSPPPPPPLQDSYRLFDDENPNSCSVM